MTDCCCHTDTENTQLIKNKQDGCHLSRIFFFIMKRCIRTWFDLSTLDKNYSPWAMDYVLSNHPTSCHFHVTFSDWHVIEWTGGGSEKVIEFSLPSHRLYCSCNGWRGWVGGSWFISPAPAYIAHVTDATTNFHGHWYNQDTNDDDGILDCPLMNLMYIPVSSMPGKMMA